MGIGVGRWQTPGLHGVAGEVGLKLLETAEACAKLNEMPGFSKHAAQIARARGVEEIREDWHVRIMSKEDATKVNVTACSGILDAHLP